MLTQILALIYLTVFTQNLTFICSSIIPPPPPFNLSHFIFPKVTALTFPSSAPQPRYFLQEVLDAIANKEKWVLEDMRALELDVKKAKYGSMKRYEFRVRVGKSAIMLKMYEEVEEWKKLAAVKENGSSDFESLVKKIGSEAIVDSYKIEGPFELQVVGDDDHLTLMLPANISHSGLKRISVSKGITVEVKGAKEISIVHLPDHQQGSFGISNNTRSIWPAQCMASMPIRIKGCASVVAYRTQRPAAHMQMKFTSRYGIELLPEKCYVSPNYEKPKHLFGSSALLERLLRSFLSDKSSRNTELGSVKSRIRSSTVFRFQLEVERYIRSNDTYWSTLAEWRTRPPFERVWFEVSAKIEGDVLKPLVIKKVRPFIDVDSFAWSSLLSNLSFTMFPSVLVPPEALTLDVKW